jgi:histidinol dehydrogenase
MAQQIPRGGGKNRRHESSCLMKRLCTTNPDFADDFDALLAQGRATTEDVGATVSAIIADIRTRGDAALVEYTRRFDRFEVTAASLRITEADIARAQNAVPAALRDALEIAATRIESFHRAQMPRDIEYTDDDGITLGMRWGALDAAGIYVPGGKASYPSSVLMNAIPARIAGVKRIAMAVPTPDGVINPLVLVAAARAGITEIWRIGGAQAIAALAYGTANIAPVDRITGPGNAFVAEAKRQVFGRTGIDGVAGPSEVVILADQDNDPAHVAIDLLAQAEHDEAAQSILITNSKNFADKVEREVFRALETLPRAAIAAASIKNNGAIIVTESIAQAYPLIDRLAPEHLQIMLPDPRGAFAEIRHAGAAFLGRYVPEALGDYIAGPNHVLPTGRTARFASGLSVYDFLKRTTWIDADRGGFVAIARAAASLALAEGLDAHAQSLQIRL